MTVRNIRKVRGLLSAAGPFTLAFVLAQAPVQAQPAGDFQLPTTSASPAAAPRVQGPVDADNPVAAPRAQPVPSEAPAAATPVVTPSAAPSAAPPPAATRRAAAPRAQATAMPTAASPAPVETAAASDATTSTPLPTPAPTQTVTAAPAATAPAGEVPWAWFGGGALLAALGCGFMLSRRKPAVTDEAENSDAPADDIPVAPSPLAEIQSEPLPAPLPEPVIAPTPTPLTIPEPAFAAVPTPSITVAFEPARLSATLVNTALDYRVTLTNTGSETAESLVIAADMIGAQSGLPAEAQIASAQLSLPERHRVAALAAGESVTLSGSIRLPLAEITPIRQGEARLFVPLVRLRLSAGNDADAPVPQLYTWVIGGSADTPEARLRPFRLDLGPRIFAEVSHRLL